MLFRDRFPRKNNVKHQVQVTESSADSSGCEKRQQGGRRLQFKHGRRRRQVYSEVVLSPVLRRALHLDGHRWVRNDSQRESML